MTVWCGAPLSPQVLKEVLSQRRTVLIVTHQLKILEKADHIIFLEQGSVVEEGTHLELMDRKGHYHRLKEELFSKQLNCWSCLSTVYRLIKVEMKVLLHRLCAFLSCYASPWTRRTEQIVSSQDRILSLRCVGEHKHIYAWREGFARATG